MATPANTPTQYYLSNANVASACKKNFEKIDKECAPEEKREKSQHPMLNKLLGPKTTQKLEDISAKVKSRLKTTDDNRWMSHCHGLWIKPASVDKDLEEFNKMYQKISNDVKGSLQSVVDPMLNQLKDAVEAETQSFAESQAKKALLREIGEVALGGGPEDPIGDVVAGVDRIVTIVKVASFSPQILEQLKDLVNFKNLATQAIGELNDLAGNAKNMTPTQMMATGMGVLARVNPCTRARRCLLVPYRKTGTTGSLGGQGCCPGQTGHHILPDEMAKDGNCPGDGTNKYKAGDAPTICVEGTNNGNGTHGQIHDVLVGQMDKYKSGFFGKDTMSYETATKKGIHSVMRTFPESRCDPNCLKQQLDAYYKKLCTKDLPAVAGKQSKGEDNLIDNE